MGSREYIKDEKGDYVKSEHGHRKFYSTEDGESHPDHEQTVYVEFDTALGKANSKTGEKYNPSTGKIK